MGGKDKATCPLWLPGFGPVWSAVGDRVGPLLSSQTLSRARYQGGDDAGWGAATSILSFGRDGGGVMHRDVLAAVLVLKL